MKIILEVLLTLILIAGILAAFIIPVELFNLWDCGRLPYQTQYYALKGCYIRYNYNWYPEDTFYTKLENNMEFIIEGVD